MSAGPHVSDKKNRGRGCDGAAVAKLADGGVSGDDDGTNVTASTSRTYQATWMDLLSAFKTTAVAMAVRWFSSTA